MQKKSMDANERFRSRSSCWIFFKIQLSWLADNKCVIQDYNLRFICNDAQVASTSTTDDEDEEIKWRKWVDKTFVQLITVNIYRTAKESWQTFDYITSHGNFNFFERQAARLSGSGLMYAISGRLIKKYGIQGDLRQALYGAASDWVHALGDFLKIMIPLAWRLV